MPAVTAAARELATVTASDSSVLELSWMPPEKSGGFFVRLSAIPDLIDEASHPGSRWHECLFWRMGYGLVYLLKRGKNHLFGIEG